MGLKKGNYMRKKFYQDSYKLSLSCKRVAKLNLILLHCVCTSMFLSQMTDEKRALLSVFLLSAYAFI